MNGSRFLGKYRGSVVNNVDPLQQGRLQAMVPDVLGSAPSSWALPCLPFAGAQAGLWSVPPVGAGVWMEFEQGDPEYPVWTGGWWGHASEVPAQALAVPPTLSHVLVQTTAQNSLSISDAPGPAGGLLLKCSTGAMIMINDVGITISNGQGATILLTGPTVDINSGALTVT